LTSSQIVAISELKTFENPWITYPQNTWVNLWISLQTKVVLTLAPDLTKIMAKYCRHEPPPVSERMAA
jgi:hypothetical protein